MHIGENSWRLGPIIRERYSHLPWRGMLATRNVIAHSYRRISHELIRNTVDSRLDELKAVCLTELAAEKIQGD